MYASRGLTSTETRYAQIEKELLAIVFACNHFEAYIYRRDAIQVETDHQLLVSIMKKPINSAPSRLQRILLRLQKYNLNLKYKRGPTMYLADTLSQGCLPDVNACEFSHQLKFVYHTVSLAMAEDHLQQLIHASSYDSVLQMLQETMRQSWPENKSKVPDSTHAYYNFRDAANRPRSAGIQRPTIGNPSWYA